MRTIARFMDARNTAEGKFLSVLLSVLLVFSFLNVTMFTDYANATDETAPEVAVEENQSLDVVDPVTDEPEDEAQEGEGAPEQEHPESEEPAGEVNEIEGQPEEGTGDSEQPADNEKSSRDKEADSTQGMLTGGAATFAMVDTYASNNQYITVSAGESISVKGSSGYWWDNDVWQIRKGHSTNNNSWNDDKAGDARISDKGSRSVQLTVGNGAKAGDKYTIRHQTDRNSYEYIYITVGAKAEQTTRVYVYIKVHGDTTGWQENGDGWFTIGYVDVPSSELPAAPSYSGDYPNVNVTKYFDALVRHNDNKDMDFDFNEVDWTDHWDGDLRYGVHKADGASGYADEAPNGTDTWHLDGSYTIQEKTYSLTVTYKFDEDCAANADESLLPKTHVQDGLKFGDSYNVVSPSIKGYVADPSAVSGQMANKDVSREVVYHRDANGNNIPDCQEDRYSVTYLPGEHGAFREQTTENILTGMPTPEFVGNKTGEDGWKFDGWNPAVSDTVTQDVTYTAKWKQTKFTVTYDLNGGLIPGDNTQVKFECAKDAITPKPAADPIKWGFTFNGWSPEVAPTVTADVTYTAQWEAFKYHLVIAADTTNSVYDGNERSGALADLKNIEGIGYAVEARAKEDGKIFYITGYEPKIAKNDDSYGTAIDAGTYTVIPVKTGADVKVYDENGKLYSGKHPYEISVQAGEHVIKPRPVTITADSAEKEFDGAALTAPGWKVSEAAEGTGLVGSDKVAAVKVAGSQTYPGSSANVPSDAVMETGKASNYKFEYVNGILRVTDRAAKYVINAAAPDATYTYDGAQKTAEGVSFDQLTFDGKTYTVTGLTSKASGTDAGEYAASITGTATVWDGETNVTEQFQVNTTDTGKLTIKPRPVTFTSGTATKVYDGEALTARSWTANEPTEAAPDEGLLASDAGKIVAVYRSGITLPGTVKNEFGIDSNPYEALDNYDVTLVPGTLTVIAQSIDPKDPTEPDPEDPSKPVYKGVTVEAPANVVYDGDEHKGEPVVKSGDKTLAKGVDYELSYEGQDVVNAGEVTVAVRGIGGYAGEVETTYQIIPRRVSLSSASASKPYDGTALTRPNVSIGGDGFVAGEATARATGSVTEVVEGDVTNTIEIVPGAKFEKGNYSITRTEGTLRILASGENDVTIDGINGLDGRGIVKTYDGQTVAVVAEAAVRENSTVEYSVDGGAWTAQQPTFLNADTYEVAVRATNPNYETVEKAVTVVVNRAPVTVAAAASKTAGAADPALTATVSGMVNGEPASLISYTVARAAGELVGSYQIVPTGLAIQGNYAVTYVPATLTISAAPVVPPTVTPVVPTAPVVTPAAVTPAPTPPAPAAPAPAAAPAAAAPAPAAEPIEDDATPQAAAPAERTPLAETEEIEDEATPMGAFDEPHCWVHWVMLLGILITAAYGAIVVRRRLHLADDVDDYEKQVLGIEDEAPEAVPADGRQAL